MKGSRSKENTDNKLSVKKGAAPKAAKPTKKEKAVKVWKHPTQNQLAMNGVVSHVYKQWYVLYPEEGPWFELLVIPRFELLCSIMIPISIKVSLDLVKSLYAKFIDWDYEMIDHETGIPSHATNTAISEDLGQVEYIMTDKVGMLTENKMIFRRCCIRNSTI